MGHGSVGPGNDSTGSGALPFNIPAVVSLIIHTSYRHFMTLNWCRQNQLLSSWSTGNVPPKPWSRSHCPFRSYLSKKAFPEQSPIFIHFT